MVGRSRRNPHTGSAALFRVIAFAISLGLLLASLGCREGGDYTRPGRVIVIGIDGASPRVMNELLRQGRVPNLEMIAKQGAFGVLRSAMPIHSPRIWNTIATGKVPEKHGIIDFAYKDDKGELHLFLASDRKARTIWSIASKAGLSVATVNLWNTYPLEKVNGVIVSDHLLAKEIDGRERMTGSVKTDIGNVIYPDEWNDRLSRLVLEETTPVADFENPFAEGKVLPRWVLRDELSRRFAEDGALARITQEISRELRPDFLMLLLPGIDRVSHYLWGVMEPEDAYPEGLRPTPLGRAGGKAALLSYYEYTDALIGELIADYGENDLIMVISDHGFEAGQALMRLSGVHESEKAIDGVFFARGPGIDSGTRVNGLAVNDITPTLLAWMAIPTALDMDGLPAGFLRVPIAEPIKTHDIGTIEFVVREANESGLEDDIVEQLKTLGYLGEE